MSSPYDHDAPVETMWEGRFVVVRRKGRWEYAERPAGVRAAVILAIDDGHVLLIDQYRVPIGRHCLELPAGLVGDLSPGEAAEDAAARELEEETGYRAGRIDTLGEYFSSPGMLGESFTLVRASALEKVGDGGGDADEDIRVHRVPLAGVADFVEACRSEGLAIDVKLLMLLGADWLADG